MSFKSRRAIVVAVAVLDVHKAAVEFTGVGLHCVLLDLSMYNENLYHW